MRRKVIQIAESTQLVSLPRKWAIQYGIKKGDELDVVEEGSRLIISTERKQEMGKITVDISALDRDMMMFLLRALYKNGYDDITLWFKHPECLNFRSDKPEQIVDVLATEVSRLNGVEIFTRRIDHCIIRTISEDTAKVFDTMLRRTFLIFDETIKELIEGYETKNYSLLNTIQQKHDAITKLIVYCQRLVNKLGYPDHRKTNTIYHILEVLDTMMDFLKYNSRIIIEEKIHPSEQGISICASISKSFHTFYELYYDFKLEKVSELNKQRHMFLKQIIVAQKKMKKNELSFLSNMEQIFEHILNLTNARIALEY